MAVKHISTNHSNIRVFLQNPNHFWNESGCARKRAFEEGVAQQFKMG